MRKAALLLLFILTTESLLAQQSLVPSTPSTAPDYFCTWNIQGYVTSYTGSEAMRNAMDEENLFGSGAFQRWVRFFPEIRQDLLLVLDDSWDIPAVSNHKNNNQYIGTLELDVTRFPSFRGSPVERMRQLADSVERCGWRGLGLWVSAQKAEVLDSMNEDVFWTTRLRDAEAAHVCYWKVDWGRRDRDDTFRRMIAEKARQLAPNLILENAMKEHYATFSDAFRTYDVENIIAQPVTIERVCRLLSLKAEPPARGIINCEDEPYIAVGLGCAIGIMRHPFAGSLPNGRDDEAFPATIRDLKHRLEEVIRAVRWHRIAAPFGVDDDSHIDSIQLHDYWTYAEGESWVHHTPGEAVRAQAPARVSRRMSLPEVASSATDRPFVLASRYPNGATAVAAIGRTLDRSYVCRSVPVSIDIEKWSAPIGLFGSLGDITLRFAHLPNPKTLRVLAQDLKADRASDITSACHFRNNSLTVSEDIIRRIGLAAASYGDISDPGLVISIVQRK